ncbi:MAG: hypothetical protein AAF415_16135 [Pseudomonadota bacterium]
MRQALLAISLVLLPGLSLAQDQMTLIASDQGTFSRVRVILDGRSYALEQVGPRQFDLLLPGADVSFDTSQIFPGRRASRITSARKVVDQAGGRVRLSLNCDCRASMSADDGLLTLDFHEPGEAATPEGTFADLNVPPVEPVATEAPLTEPEDAEAETLAGVAANDALNDAASDPVAETPAFQAEPVRGGTALAPDNSLTPRRAQRRGVASASNSGSGVPEVTAETAIDRAEIEAAQQRLLQQLTRAAEQGLLEFRDPETAEDFALAEPGQDALEPDAVDPKVAPVASEAGPPLRPGASADPTAGSEPPGGPALASAGPATPDGTGPGSAPSASPSVEPDPQVRVRTAYDRDFASVAQVPPAEISPGQSQTDLEEKPVCIPDLELAISDWGTSGDPAQQIAALRRDLLGEFDQSDPKQLVRLARLYIHHGLGAEASQILRLYGEGLPETPLLTDMARVIDGYPVSPHGPLAEAGMCSGAVSLWAGAARLPFPEEISDPDNEAALLDAFATLSPQIRRLLGPQLLLNALDSDREVLAMKIDLLLGRVPGDNGPAYDLARARLLDAKGKVAEAEAAYAALARGATMEAPEALLLLFDSLRRRGAALPSDLTEGLAIAAFMHRQSPLGRKLKIAEFRARAGTDGLPEVLDQIARTIAQTEGDVTDLRDAGHAILETATAAEAGDVDYSRAVLAYQEQIATSAAGDNARIVASGELLSTGLPNAALDVLRPALRRGGPSVMLAAARAHLAMDAPDAALQVLNGLEGAEAARLRAQAFEKSGAPGEALNALSEASDGAPDGPDLTEERAALSWQAGEWEGAASAGPDQRRILAAYMAGQSAEDALGTPAVPGSEVEAFLAPPELGRDLTMRDARSVMEASKNVRTLIEEALEDG